MAFLNKIGEIFLKAANSDINKGRSYQVVCAKKLHQIRAGGRDL